MIIEIKKKIGRPTKEVEVKKTVKSKYNSNYYLTRKVLKNISTNNQNFNLKEYKNAIIDFFDTYDFNYFFTGTANANYIQKENLKVINDKIKKLNKEFGTTYQQEIIQPIGLNSLTKYTNKFINYLLENNTIDRALIFYEQNKRKEWHTHILLNVTNNLIKDVNNYIENKWLLGICLNIEIPTKEDKKEIISYSTKQLSIYEKSNKNLNWNLAGNYKIENVTNLKNNNMNKDLTKKQKEDFLSKYKNDNNLEIKFSKSYIENQKRLSEKFVTLSN